MKNTIAIVAVAAFIGMLYYTISGNDEAVEATPSTEKVEFTSQPIEEVEESEEAEMDDIETLEAEVDADIEELENLDF